jgi:hypothetical protein
VSQVLMILLTVLFVWAKAAQLLNRWCSFHLIPIDALLCLIQSLWICCLLALHK